MSKAWHMVAGFQSSATFTFPDKLGTHFCWTAAPQSHDRPSPSGNTSHQRSPNPGTAYSAQSFMPDAVHPCADGVSSETILIISQNKELKSLWSILVLLTVQTT